MNLTEVQSELDNIEKNISRLKSEIVKMNLPKIEEKKITIDYGKITEMAKKAPITINTIKNERFETAETLLSALSCLVSAEDEGFGKRLLYLNRLYIGCGHEMSAEEICKCGFEFDIEKLRQICEENANYKYTFLVEAFIILNLSGDISEKLLSCITDMAEILSCDKEEIGVTATVAKSVLLGNTDCLLQAPVQTKRWAGRFRDYIPYDWIVKNRKYLPKYPETEIYGNIQYCKQKYDMVKAGDVLIKYKKYSDSEKKKVIAPCDGIFFFTKDNGSLCVASYFDKYTDYCSDWTARNASKTAIASSLGGLFKDYFDAMMNIYK